MAEKKKPVREGGRYCVAGAPNNQSCTNTSYTPGISMHQFPVDRAVREKWLKFVQRHRLDFNEPISKHAFLCSVHFERSWEQLQNTLQLIYMSLNKNSVYCVIPRSSKPPDTCKWGRNELRGILKFSQKLLRKQLGIHSLGYGEHEAE